VIFAEVDRNSNFVSDDILHDFVAHLKNHENCNPCPKNFVRDGIVDSLMK